LENALRQVDQLNNEVFGIKLKYQQEFVTKAQYDNALKNVAAL